MKTIAVLLSLLFAVTSVGVAGPKSYGKELTVKQKTLVSEILAQPGKFDGKRVRVEGNVVNVCAKRGCWIEISSDKEFQSIRFKVDDGVIVFPIEEKGKQVEAEGIVKVTTVSVEQQVEQGKHHAEETGETFDPASVKGPKVSVMLKGEGAVIR